MCQYCGGAGWCVAFFSVLGMKLFSMIKKWLKNREKKPAKLVEPQLDSAKYDESRKTEIERR